VVPTFLLGGNPDFMAREFLKQSEVDPDEATDEQWNGAFARAKQIVEDEHNEGRVASAVCTSSARNVTSRAVLTISFVDVRAARATRDRRGSSCRWKTI
jgi:hypothetical protein